MALSAALFSHPLPYALGAMAAATAFTSMGVHLSTTEAQVKSQLSPAEGFRHFQLSYPLWRNMQVGYIVATVASGLTAAALSVGYIRQLYVAGAVLTGLVFPFTVFVLLPTNKQILGTPAQETTEKSRELLTKWALINWVRPIATLASVALFAVAICTKHA